eukprot:scaffold68_cov340-Pavlova_lutheri.AAC.22
MERCLHSVATSNMHVHAAGVGATFFTRGRPDVSPFARETNGFQEDRDAIEPRGTTRPPRKKGSETCVEHLLLEFVL